MTIITHLSRAERMQRIGELLSKGIALMLAREAQDKKDRESAPATDSNGTGGAKAPEPNGDLLRLNIDETDGAILDYLKRVGRASPRDIQSGLGLSKPTVFRRLSRLLHLNLIVRAGSTSAIRYRLTSTEGAERTHAL